MDTFSDKEIFDRTPNPIALISMARQQVAATGAGDSEFETLDGIEKRFKAGSIDAFQVEQEVDALIAARSDYH